MRNHPVTINIIVAYGMTGGDTIAKYHNIGKGTDLKVFRTELHSLNKVADINFPMVAVIQLATPFMISLYGIHDCETMTDGRQ